MVILKKSFWAIISTSVFSCHVGVVVRAVPLAAGLADPALQDLFVQDAPNALAPEYIMNPQSGQTSMYSVGMGKNTSHYTGLKDSQGLLLPTTIFGYSEGNKGQYLWPGKTIVQNVESAGGSSQIEVEWINNLRNDHILPVDTTVHWCFSMHGYEQYTLADDGIPVSPHVHGGRTEFQFVRNAILDC